MRIVFFMVAGGLAVGIVYSAFKLWEDTAAGGRGLGFHGLLGVLGVLGALVVLGLLLGLGML